MVAKRKLSARADLCRDCQACTLACSLFHEGECNLGLARLVVAKDMARYEFNILICQHCDPPECMLVCPTDAIALDRCGIAALDDNLCIRCGACRDACPYGAILYNESEDRYLKCDLCGDRVGGPVCVEVCPVAALTSVTIE